MQVAMRSGGGKRVAIVQFCNSNPLLWCPAWPTSAFNSNTPAFFLALCVPHDYNRPRLPSATSPQYTHAHSLLKSISALHYHPIWTHTFFRLAIGQNLIKNCRNAGGPATRYARSDWLAAQDIYTLFTWRQSQLPVRLNKWFANLTW